MPGMDGANPVDLPMPVQLCNAPRPQATAITPATCHTRHTTDMTAVKSRRSHHRIYTYSRNCQSASWHAAHLTTASTSKVGLTAACSPPPRCQPARRLCLVLPCLLLLLPCDYVGTLPC